jgi:hypothetical protein
VSVWIMRANSKLPDEIVVKGVETRTIAPAVELATLDEIPGVPPVDSTLPPEAS